MDIKFASKKKKIHDILKYLHEAKCGIFFSFIKIMMHVSYFVHVHLLNVFLLLTAHTVIYTNCIS